MVVEDSMVVEDLAVEDLAVEDSIIIIIMDSVEGDGMEVVYMGVACITVEGDGLMVGCVEVLV